MRKNVLMSSGLNKEMSNHLITFLPYQEEGHSVRERERENDEQKVRAEISFLYTHFPKEPVPWNLFCVI